MILDLILSLREKCLYSELFWSVFSRIWTEYGGVRSISPYSVRMREKTDQNNSECGNVLQFFSSRETFQGQVSSKEQLKLLHRLTDEKKQSGI